MPNLGKTMRETAKHSKGSTSRKPVLQTGGTTFTYKGNKVSESKFYRNTNPDYQGGFRGQNDGRKD